MKTRSAALSLGKAARCGGIAFLAYAAAVTTSIYYYEGL